MTDIETIRQYCLSLPLTGEDMAFGEEHLLFRVCDKIFACYSFERDNYLSLKRVFHNKSKNLSGVSFR
ncbi:MAG: MmcQ/YjbR family DNA-binding protein, partial [Duncaniella sp.]|nr:MmcQ/YjbR family DNA-binding protein [Duncaniella sp.]